MKTLFPILDDTMSGWQPKTSKLGGLPNFTFEPRKPVPLGTMFKYGAECLTGIMAFQDVVQNTEVQKEKQFYGEKSHLPNSVAIGTSTADILWIIEGSALQEGGWIGGDARFGSVMTAVEAAIHFRVKSTWIVKGNMALYPMEALHTVLQARFGTKKDGHWVVLKIYQWH
jgi:hypothetical protein